VLTVLVRSRVLQIRFYCLGSRGSGAALMAAAAVGGHREALYSLAVIQFNGSGGGKDDRDLRAGAALCARAASLGHVDALRELGHCLQDGYGVRRSVLDGRRLLIQANARELAASSAAAAPGSRTTGSSSRAARTPTPGAASCDGDAPMADGQQSNQCVVTLPWPVLQCWEKKTKEKKISFSRCSCLCLWWLFM